MSELPCRAADTAVDPVVVRSEDRLHAGTVNVVVGRARLITSVVVEEQTITVPVRRQQIRLVHEAVPESEQVVTDVAPAEETYEVVAYAEQVLVTTQVVPVERVRLIKRVTEQTVVSGQVRCEQVDVDITAPPASRPLNNVTLEER
jgi:stress response protein YsnF